MTDLTSYIPQSNDWMKEVITTQGEEFLSSYYNQVFLRLYAMQVGERLEVEKVCRPKNYRLFIRVACTVINELSRYGLCFALENRATVIIRE